MMKLLASFAFLSVLAAGNTLNLSRSNASNFAFGNNTVKVAAEFNNPADDVLWEKAICRGKKLLVGMTLDIPDAGRVCQPMVSPWDGTLEHELSIWGYSDISDDAGLEDDCDMGEGNHGLDDMLEIIDADDRSSIDGGDNICYTLQHRDGDAVKRDEDGGLPEEDDQYYDVDDREYRITGAYFKIGVNPRAGIIYFLNRESPEAAAKDLWGVPSVTPEQMPALRSSSDIAWGLWNRVSGRSLSNINYFFSVSITNDETLQLIDRAMITEDHNYMPYAPGVTFTSETETEAFNALLGSSNAIGAAYFLVQHKPQFGHNRYISEISVFKANGNMDQISMLMKVEQALPAPQLMRVRPNVQGRSELRSPANLPFSPLNVGNTKNDTRVEPTRKAFHMARRHILWV